MKKNFTITTLKENPHLFNQSLSLIEKSFKYQNNHHFCIDFAPLVDQKNWHHNFLLFDQQKQQPVAHIGVLKNNLSFSKKNISFPIAFLGGIAVDENYRGQGLFNQLLNYVLQYIEKEVSFIMLWSDLVELYQKYNFQLLFGFYEINLQQLKTHHSITKNISTYTNIELNKLSHEDISKLCSLYDQGYQNDYFTLQRTLSDWEFLKKITSTHLFISRNPSQEITSYFFAEKGEDLKRVIHEFCHSKEIDPAVITSFPYDRLWLPEDNQHILFQKYKSFVSLKYLSLSRIGSFPLVKQLIKDISNNEIKIIQMDHRQTNFQYSGEQIMLPTHEFLSNLFGPNPVVEFRKFFTPLFISGLDSI